jgi:small subunit ribosomal protein S6
MRDYEVAFIAQPDLDESSLNNLIEKTRGWVNAVGGQVLKVDNWGRRRLSYPIRKQREGQYIFLQTQMSPAATREVERNLRLTEQVMRFLIVRADE